MAKKNTAAAVKEIALPVAETLGLRIWDVQFVKEGPDWHLRIIIDKDGGVSIDDCEAMSRAIDPLIDELDPTDHQYYLIVSSPGLGRALKSDEHLQGYIGQKISVRLFRPDEEKQRDYSGILTAYDAESITIDDNKNIERKDAASIKAADDEDLGGFTE